MASTSGLLPDLTSSFTCIDPVFFLWRRKRGGHTIGLNNPPMDPMNRTRVLLAEDSPAVAHQLRTLLGTEFDVIGMVDDGLSLLSAVRRMKPDVLVTDISLPQVDGLMAAEQLLSEAAVPCVVFITVHDDPALVDRALRIGHCGYVLKADAGEDLLCAVHEVHRGRSFISASIATRRALRDADTGRLDQY
ncbi:response regulator [Lysobacter sp. F60174L2]|uniref:response regulator n=1 Tax=Lysobacter sp. F60174L2 TaxID=3459295 RepID=UPI00403D6A38